MLSWLELCSVLSDTLGCFLLKVIPFACAKQNEIFLTFKINPVTSIHKRTVRLFVM